MPKAVTPPSETVEEAFRAFWAAYPWRAENPRAPALAVFLRLVKAGEDPDALVRAASAYAAFCDRAKKPDTFIPHARTWLAQRRFEDFADVPAGDGHGAHPEPEHPLAWLKDEIGEAAWRSWIEPLQLVAGDAPIGVLARTQIALDHVRRHYGARLRERYGDLAWGLQPKEAS